MLKTITFVLGVKGTVVAALCIFCSALIFISMPAAIAGAGDAQAHWDGDNITLKYKTAPLYPKALIALVRDGEADCDRSASVTKLQKATPKTDAEILATKSGSREIYLSGSKKAELTEMGGAVYPYFENTCNVADTRPSSRTTSIEITTDDRTISTSSSKGKVFTEITESDPTYLQTRRARRMKEMKNTDGATYKINTSGLKSVKSVNGYPCGYRPSVPSLCIFENQQKHIPTDTVLFVERTASHTVARKDLEDACRDPAKIEAMLKSDNAGLTLCAESTIERLVTVSYGLPMPLGIFEIPALAKSGQTKHIKN